MNLALALKGRSDVDDVDFATVWNKKHTLAERTGSSIDNFIAWVKKSTEAEDQKNKTIEKRLPGISPEAVVFL